MPCSVVVRAQKFEVFELVGTPFVSADSQLGQGRVQLFNFLKFSAYFLSRCPFYRVMPMDKFRNRTEAPTEGHSNSGRADVGRSPQEPVNTLYMFLWEIAAALIPIGFDLVHSVEVCNA